MKNMKKEDLDYEQHFECAAPKHWQNMQHCMPRLFKWPRVVYKLFFCGINSTYLPTWHHFPCVLKKEDVGYCGKVNRERESGLCGQRARGWIGRAAVFTLILQDLYFLLPTKPTLPLFVYLPAITHVIFFQNAWKVMSGRCVPGRVDSAKKQHLYYSCRYPSIKNWIER